MDCRNIPRKAIPVDIEIGRDIGPCHPAVERRVDVTPGIAGKAVVIPIQGDGTAGDTTVGHGQGRDVRHHGPGALASLFRATVKPDVRTRPVGNWFGIVPAIGRRQIDEGTRACIFNPRAGGIAPGRALDVEIPFLFVREKRIEPGGVGIEPGRLLPVVEIAVRGCPDTPHGSPLVHEHVVVIA